MTIKPRVVTPPFLEPVTLEEAKLHCKVDGNAEDALFRIYITAAREFFEDSAAYTIHQQTLEATFDQWPWWYSGGSTPPLGFNGAFLGSHLVLPRATPLISITSVTYTDITGALAVWDPANYIADADSVPGRIGLPYNGLWPTTLLAPANGIRIRYTAGIATASPVTEAEGAIKLPILMLIAGMYANRESEAWEDNRATLIAAISMRYGVEAFIARIRDRVAPTSY